MTAEQHIAAVREHLTRPCKGCNGSCETRHGESSCPVARALASLDALAELLAAEVAA